MSTTTVVFIVLLVFLVLILLRKGYNMYDQYEESTTTTTTTTTSPAPEIVGNLQRQKEGDQFFVIDPVDQKKIWLNSNDDMYEDADDKIWRLI